MWEQAEWKFNEFIGRRRLQVLNKLKPLKKPLLAAAFFSLLLKAGF
jgi:hypothetical protein